MNRGQSFAWIIITVSYAASVLKPARQERFSLLHRLNCYLPLLTSAIAAYWVTANCVWNSVQRQQFNVYRIKNRRWILHCVMGVDSAEVLAQQAQ